MKKVSLPFVIAAIVIGCADLRHGEIESQPESSALFMSPKVCVLNEGQYYSIRKLVDGDTFWLQDSCEGVKIRLIGIDSPECKNHFGKTTKEPFGDEATQYMASLLDGQRVRVEFDVDTFDQFDRTLAYCYTENGKFINLEMLKAGLAQVMTVTPNVEYEDVFYKAQVEARKNQLNIWQGTQ